MAIFTAYSEFDISYFATLGDGALTPEKTATTAVKIDTLADPDVTYALTGTGFTFDADDITGGTLTEVAVKLGTAAYFTVSGLSYDMNNSYYETGVLFGVNNRLYGMKAELSQWLIGNDRIIGSAAGDWLVGFSGNDTMIGAAGHDFLDGWGGDDVLVGGEDGDDLYGDTGNDRLFGGSGQDWLYGNSENDVLSGGTGRDWMFGGTGWDVVTYNDLAANADGYTIRVVGNLSIRSYPYYGGAGIEVTDNATPGVAATLIDHDYLKSVEQINGSNSRDYISLGTAGWQEGVRGYAGNDTIVGGGGSDADFARYDGYLASGSQVVIDLSTATDTATVYDASGAVSETDTLIDINGAVGTAGNDTMTGSSGNDWFRGLKGNDSFVGGTGNDWFRGQEGNDSFVGGDGSDWIDYQGDSSALNITLVTDSATVQSIDAGAHGTDEILSVEHIAGGNAADSLTGNNLSNHLRGNGGNDTLTGGDGIDYANYKKASSGVTVTWSSATEATATSVSDGNDVLNTIEGAYGSAYNDRFTGNAGNEVLLGGAGQDFLSGGAGQDSLSGGAGNDTLDGGDGADTLSGGSGGDGLDGGSGNDSLCGGSGYDDLNGGDGDDSLDGGQSVDSLTGGAGNDTIDGGQGTDTLTGGTGSDTFLLRWASDTAARISGCDVIIDFKHGEGDRIDLAYIDADTALAGHQAFVFSGVATSLPSFTTAGDLKLYGGVLYGNTDTDATAEFAIRLTGVSTLTAADFIL